jgi:hypothetical protein
MRTTLLAAGFATLLAAPLALAGERHAFVPTAPSSPAELTQVGGGTIAGTVTELAGARFTLAELTTAVPVAVDARRLRLDGLAPGEPVTVTGTMKDGELRARQLIRGDGSVATPARTHDDEDEDGLAAMADEEEDEG